MNKFDYVRVASPQAAAQAVQGNSSACLIAGGTDLIPLMKEDIVSPALLVDLSAWKEGKRIERQSDTLRIGALATLADIAAHPLIRQQYAALADACRLAAAPQLRNMGTIGGNLLQQTRCWYYRGPFDCWLKGGETCYARSGENEQHSIFNTDQGRNMCVSAHPSDPAAALLALDALVEYTTPSATVRISISDLFALPTSDRRTFTTLPTNAVITSVLLPVAAVGRRSLYRKAMPRAAWSFALAGVALSITLDKGMITEARVALSGVSPIPLRAAWVEEHLIGQTVGRLDFDAASRKLTEPATPLSQNGYKVDLLQGLFTQTLREITAG